jgi:Methyltransferase FkbM domain
MRIFLKIFYNLGPRAILVLGPVAYVRYLFLFIRHLGDIGKTGNFKALDKAMGSKPLKVRVNGVCFAIDCPFSDLKIQDGTYTFGIMREMYIRNCYLRDGIAERARAARTVMDLGANRGAFSVMMARRAQKVVAVEFNPDFREVIARNMEINGFTHYAVETAIVGSGGKVGEEGVKGSKEITIPELLEKHGMERVDLLKMDIEGSEYALFREPAWLDRVSALCMEVHPPFGRVQDILDTLASHGFQATARDQTFQKVREAQQAEFIYAWKAGA